MLIEKVKAAQAQSVVTITAKEINSDTHKQAAVFAAVNKLVTNLFADDGVDWDFFLSGGGGLDLHLTATRIGGTEATV